MMEVRIIHGLDRSELFKKPYVKGVRFMKNLENRRLLHAGFAKAQR
jgi:hypothetical protein